MSEQEKKEIPEDLANGCKEIAETNRKLMPLMEKILGKRRAKGWMDEKPHEPFD